MCQGRHLNDDQYFPHTKGEISVSEALGLFKDVSIDIFLLAVLQASSKGTQRNQDLQILHLQMTEA